MSALHIAVPVVLTKAQASINEYGEDFTGGSTEELIMYEVSWSPAVAGFGTCLANETNCPEGDTYEFTAIQLKFVAYTSRTGVLAHPQIPNFNLESLSSRVWYPITSANTEATGLPGIGADQISYNPRTAELLALKYSGLTTAGVPTMRIGRFYLEVTEGSGGESITVTVEDTAHVVSLTSGNYNYLSTPGAIPFVYNYYTIPETASTYKVRFLQPESTNLKWAWFSSASAFGIVVWNWYYKCSTNYDNKGAMTFHITNQIVADKNTNELKVIIGGSSLYGTDGGVYADRTPTSVTYDHYGDGMLSFYDSNTAYPDASVAGIDVIGDISETLPQRYLLKSLVAFGGDTSAADINDHPTIPLMELTSPCLGRYIGDGQWADVGYVVTRQENTISGGWGSPSFPGWEYKYHGILPNGNLVTQYVIGSRKQSDPQPLFDGTDTAPFDDASLQTALYTTANVYAQKQHKFETNESRVMGTTTLDPTPQAWIQIYNTAFTTYPESYYEVYE